MSTLFIAGNDMMLGGLGNYQLYGEDGVTGVSNNSVANDGVWEQVA